MRVKIKSFLSTLTLVILLQVLACSGTQQQDERQRYVLTCLARGIDCSTSWEADCCEESIDATGRNFKSMANWRFGSMFRNSIPPPRPYNPPSFDDIFGGEENQSRRHKTKRLRTEGRDGAAEKDKNYVNLRLFNGRNKAVSSISKTLPDSLDLNQSNSGKLNLLKLKQYQQLFQKKWKSGEKSVEETNRNAAQQENAQHVHQKMAGKVTTAEPVTLTVTEQTTSSRRPESRREDRFQTLDRNLYEVETSIPAYSQNNYKKIQKLNKYTTRFETTTLNDIPDIKQNVAKPKKASNPYYSSVRYGVPNTLYQTNFEDVKVVVTRKPVSSVASVSGQKFLDMSGNTRLGSDLIPVPTTLAPPVTTHQPDPTSPPEQRTEMSRDTIDRADEMENLLENDVKAESGTKDKFSVELCDVLRVPCRFVTEHPCCKLPQTIDLVARPRAMDGSADLRWRYMESGLMRDSKGPQGRMISGFSGTFPRGVATSFTDNGFQDNSIRYNYALSKDVVSVPVYHYDGGPQLTTTILSQCWRLTYLRCSLETEHPCCALAAHSQTGQHTGTLSSSVLDKWLVRH